MKKLTIIIILLIFQNSFSQEDKLFGEAEILISNKEYEKAILKLDDVLKLNPYFLGALVFRGNCKTVLKEYINAIEDYKKAVEIDSSNTLSLYNIGNNYCELNQLEKGIHYYKKAEKSVENSFSNENNLPLKRTFLNEMTPYHVSKNIIRYKKGSTFYKLKDFSSALKDFISIENQNKDSQFMIASCLLKLERNKEACIEFSKAIDLGSKKASEMKKLHCI